MRRLAANIVILAASCALGACGGAGSSSSIAPLSSQNVGAGSAVTQLANAAARRRIEHLAQSKIKHVFVLVQENHTFDQIFGLFPGVNGQYVENLGTYLAQETDCEYDPQTLGCQRPFLISANPSSPSYVQDAPDIDGGNNGRYDQEVSIDRGKMDDFLVDLEAGQPILGPTPSPQQIESHNESIAIEGVYDCDTVPYLWDYAKNFTLFDHYFQANTGDSTPSNIQLFSGQIGQTEAAQGLGTPSGPLPSGGYSDGVPISNDDNPPTSQLSFPITSYSGDNSTFQSYATMPVMLNPQMDRAAGKAKVVGYIGADISKEAKGHHQSFPWAWYEEGLYTAGAGFSAHHTAPLYFDYINNAQSGFASKQTLRDNARGNGLISDIQKGKLPSSGVFWVKGGNENTYGLVPADKIFTSNPSGQKYYVGDDDHPGSGSADHQVAEAYLAQVINAIAKSKYWKDSVIIVTWDDSGGFYDHLAPPGFGQTCPQDKTGPEEGYPCGDGVRLPAMVISPFSQTGVVVHDAADHGSVSKFIEAIFGLPTFGSLPDEAKGVKVGLSPADGDSATSNLFDALDERKLRGGGLNPPSLAEISSPSIPPKMSCSTLGITPIPSPTSLPAGYETAGFYLHQQLTGSRHAVMLPKHRDDGD
ncbi:MAG TPA: alkaline phosphatase family protein [Candidatus Acidoferrales bacterium]|jgi:phospholipase C|nr:alkaline phosphatase family protein [Candidatus Acidoferrales bacterium]